MSAVPSLIIAARCPALSRGAPDAVKPFFVKGAETADELILENYTSVSRSAAIMSFTTSRIL
jgi:hypothetical protein